MGVGFRVKGATAATEISALAASLALWGWAESKKGSFALAWVHLLSGGSLKGTGCCRPDVKPLGVQGLTYPATRDSG